jgi:FKBP-type peptidyl-prolyl cis-trans isomerase SlyD
MKEKQPIAVNTVITMQYSLANAQGVVIRDAASPPVSYLHGSGTLFPRLERALENHLPGDILTVRLLPDDAFGKRKPELLCQVPVGNFPADEDIRAGGSVVGRDENGREVRFTITEIRDDIAYLDANHPLAGQTLIFEIEIQAVRPATAEEISTGRVLD